MASFNPANLATTGLPGKRKRTTNPKLLDGNNMSLDAIRQRKLESSSLPAASTSNLETTVSAQSSRASYSTNPSRQASVEDIADEDDVVRLNAGQPKNSRFILESTDNEDKDEDTHPAPKKTWTGKMKTTNRAENEAESCEGGNPAEESDDEELSESRILTHDKLI